MRESGWCAEPPESELSVVSRVSTPCLSASCMAPREFSSCVEWMWRLRGMLLGVSFSKRAGTSVATRAAVSWPDMSLMAMAV